MEDVNPLIERYKPSLQGHSILQWRQKTIVACSKYKHQIFLGSSVLLLIICVAIVFSIIFAGGRCADWKLFSHQKSLRVGDTLIDPLLAAVVVFQN